MKKILLAIISLFLALSLACCACLAEDEARLVLPEPQDLATLFPNDTIVTKDFGDFTISYPDSMKFDPEESGKFSRDFITLYDGADTLSATWFIELKTFDDAYVATLFETVQASWEIAKAFYADSGNEWQITSASSAAVDFGGKPAGCIIYHSCLNVGGEQKDFDSYDLYIPLGEKGSYSFKISAESLADSVVLSSILNTVKWKE